MPNNIKDSKTLKYAIKAGFLYSSMRSANVWFGSCMAPNMPTKRAPTAIRTVPKLNALPRHTDGCHNGVSHKYIWVCICVITKYTLPGKWVSEHDSCSDRIKDKANCPDGCQYHNRQITNWKYRARKVGDQVDYKGAHPHWSPECMPSKLSWHNLVIQNVRFPLEGHCKGLYKVGNQRDTNANVEWSVEGGL